MLTWLIVGDVRSELGVCLREELQQLRVHHRLVRVAARISDPWALLIDDAFVRSASNSVLETARAAPSTCIRSRTPSSRPRRIFLLRRSTELTVALNG